MNKLMLVMIVWVALLSPISALGDGCPVVVTCSLDGQGMTVEATYVKGTHLSKKYGHDYYGPSGKEHHYVIVECQ